MNKKAIYAVLGVAVLGVAGFLISQALSSSLVYFILPSEYQKDSQSFDDRRVRLGGLVEVGSVKFDEEQLHLTFMITDGIAGYPVQYDGAPPDLFMENGGVVIEGKFEHGIFIGDNLLVKHSEDYHPPPDGHPIDVEALKESLR